MRATVKKALSKGILMAGIGVTALTALTAVSDEALAWSYPSPGYCLKYIDNDNDSVTVCRNKRGDWFAWYGSSGFTQYGSGFDFDTIADRLRIKRGPVSSAWRYNR